MKSEKKKKRFQNYPKKCLSYAITVLKSATMAVFNFLLNYENARLSYMKKKVIYVKKLSRDNF